MGGRLTFNIWELLLGFEDISMFQSFCFVGIICWIKNSQRHSFGFWGWSHLLIVFQALAVD